LKYFYQYQLYLYNCLVTASGGEGGAEEQNAADEDGNNSNSNVADKSSKPASASSKTQHVDDANQSVTGRYLKIEYLLHH